MLIIYAIQVLYNSCRERESEEADLLGVEPT